MLRLLLVIMALIAIVTATDNVNVTNDVVVEVREKRQFGGFRGGNRFRGGSGFGGGSNFNNNNAGFGGSNFNNNNAGFGGGSNFNNNNGKK